MLIKNMQQIDCDCENMTCTDECTQNHTHKLFWCEKCFAGEERVDGKIKIIRKPKIIQTEVKQDPNSNIEFDWGYNSKNTNEKN